MMTRLQSWVGAGALVGVGALLGWQGQGPAQAQAQDKAAARQQPVVIELFQSQGCSSCPPAIANLNALADRSDLITLSYGVTYWDYLGWADTFAKPAFTERQRRYAQSLKRNNVYTPQMVVGGRNDLVGHRRGDVDKAIAVAQAVLPQAMVNRQGRQLQVSPLPGGADAAVNATVWLVRYEPRIIDVAIKAGENNGRTLPHAHVVRDISALGQWHGGNQSFELPEVKPEQAPLAQAVLVQVDGHGPILGAARL